MEYQLRWNHQVLQYQYKMWADVSDLQRRPMRPDEVGVTEVAVDRPDQGRVGGLPGRGTCLGPYTRATLLFSLTPFSFVWRSPQDRKWHCNVTVWPSPIGARARVLGARGLAAVLAVRGEVVHEALGALVVLR